MWQQGVSVAGELREGEVHTAGPATACSPHRVREHASSQAAPRPCAQCDGNNTVYGAYLAFKASRSVTMAFRAIGSFVWDLPIGAGLGCNPN